MSQSANRHNGAFTGPSPAPTMSEVHHPNTTMDRLTAAVNDSLLRFEGIIATEVIPADIADKIEDIIQNLEYIRDWGPCDDDIIEHNSCGIAWHDGCR